MGCYFIDYLFSVFSLEAIPGGVFSWVKGNKTPLALLFL